MVMLKFRESIATDESRSYGPKQSPEIDARVEVDRCKRCGSELLFDGWFDKDGYANTDGTGTFTTICQECGQDQNRPVRRGKVRR